MLTIKYIIRYQYVCVCGTTSVSVIPQNEAHFSHTVSSLAEF
jgi:hypothetical protein